jgi:plastocyanin
MEGTRFVPEKLTVRRGDRVVWINKDPFPHTATGRIRGFDSRSIAPESSWRYVAGKAGTFPYVCTFHPTMKGTLVVE